VLTGKGLGWGGSLIRPEATGYGCVYFAAEMLAAKDESLEGKTCLVSGAGNVAQYAVGYIYDEKGIDEGKLTYVKRLKNVRRGRIKEYAEEYKEAVYTEADPTADH